MKNINKKSNVLENSFRKQNEDKKRTARAERRKGIERIKIVVRPQKERKVELRDELIEHSDFEIDDILEGFKEGYTFSYTGVGATVRVLEKRKVSRENWTWGAGDLLVKIVYHKTNPEKIGREAWVQSKYFNKIENFVMPERVKTIINRKSFEKMEFLNYNKFLINDFELNYSYLISVSDSGISCGIKQFAVINRLFNKIYFEEMLNQFAGGFEISLEITSEDWLFFCEKVMDNLFLTYKKAGFLIISTNQTNNPHFDDIAKILEKNNFVSFRNTINPNTGHVIRFWTCDLTKYRKELGIPEPKETPVNDSPLTEEEPLRDVNLDNIQ